MAIWAAVLFALSFVPTESEAFLKVKSAVSLFSEGVLVLIIILLRAQLANQKSKQAGINAREEVIGQAHTAAPAAMADREYERSS